MRSDSSADLAFAEPFPGVAPRIIVMAGVPGAGKSTLANDLGVALGCVVLSVDPVEAAMWRAGISREQPTGLAAYVVVEALAGEQLVLGHDVVIDAVNGVGAARDQWRALAARTTSSVWFIEVWCSDESEHRRRVGSRQRKIDGFPELSWPTVEAGRSSFEPWQDARLLLDSVRPRSENLQAALKYVAAGQQAPT